MLPNIAGMTEGLKIRRVAGPARKNRNNVVEIEVFDTSTSEATWTEILLPKGRPEGSMVLGLLPSGERMVIPSTHFPDGFRVMFKAIAWMILALAFSPHALLGTGFSCASGNLTGISVKDLSAVVANESSSIRLRACTFSRTEIDSFAGKIVNSLAIESDATGLAFQPNTISSHGPECNRVNSVELSIMETIPSQAVMGTGITEGVTTRSVSPNNNRSHERPTRKGRYSLNCVVTCRLGINSPIITQQLWKERPVILLETHRLPRWENPSASSKCGKYFLLDRRS